MKRFYLSGPMRGHPESNYPLFHEIEEALNFSDIEKNYPIEILNPARSFDGNRDLDLGAYFNADLRMILDCDALVLLPGWRDSEGARLEVSVAKTLGKEFWLAIEIDHNHSDIVPCIPKLCPGWTFVQIEQDDLSASTDEGIEQEARRLVYGDRAATYGHPSEDFKRVAGIWSALLGIEIDTAMVAIMMSGFKLARLVQSPEYRDNRVDVIGYMLTLDRLIRDV